VAVIELDLDAPPAPSSVRPPIHLLRPLGLALAVVLLLAVGGSGTTASLPTLWRSLGVVPLAGDDSRYELSGDHLYTVGSPFEVRYDISAWSLDPMRRDWTFTARSTATGDGVYSRANLAPADGVLLLQSESFATSILDPATGAVRWTTPGWPVPLGAGRALVQESHFRPGTEYDLKSGDPGELFWSSSGQPHTEPPLRTSLYGTDIRTGERIWTAEAPGSVFAAPIDGGSGVMVVAADKITVLDRGTGKVLRERAMPREPTDDDVAWVDVAGDLLLLRRGSDDQFGTVLAYATDTLEKRWEVEDPPGQVYNGTCIGLPCLKEESGLTVLDPLTGRSAWQSARSVQLIKRGDEVLETRVESSHPMRIRDAATGVVRLDLQVWNGPSATSDQNQPLVVSRMDAERQASLFGVLRPGGTRVQPLGYAGALMIECSSSDRYVACRVPGGIQVWAYRA
jgi:hypothetical protein